MRAIPSYPDHRAHAVEPVGYVAWRDQRHDAQSISVTRSLGAGLPSQVGAGSDLIASTGRVEMSTEALVTEGLHLPWGRPDRPRQGDFMDLYTGLSDVHARQLAGRIEGVDGDAQDPSISVDLVDSIDQLNGTVSITPLNYIMPPANEGGPYRLIGLHPTYVTDRVARASLFYATTPDDRDTAVVSAPMMGSVWPERGTLEIADTVAPEAGAAIPDYPSFASAPWGLTVTNTRSIIIPQAMPDYAMTMNRPMYVSMMVAPPIIQGRNRIVLDWGEGHRYIVRVGPAGLTVDVFSSPGGDAGEGVTTWQTPLPAGFAQSGGQVSVWLSPTGDGGANLRAQLGSTVVTGRMGITSRMTTTILERVHVYSAGEDAALGGVLVGFVGAGREFDLHDWRQTAIFETDPTDSLAGIPAIVKRSRLDLLKEQAKATLASLWIDEDRRLRYRSLARTLSQTPVATLTADDVESARWSYSWQSSRTSVLLSWQQPSCSRSRYPTGMCWQGSGAQVGYGDAWQEIVHPPDGVDWLGVSPVAKLPRAPHSPGDVQAGAQLDRWRAGVGSWVAAVTEDPDVPDSSLPAHVSWYSAGSSRLDHKSWLIRVEATSSLLGSRVLSLSSPDYANMPKHRREVDTPILRAHGIQQWEPFETVGRHIGPDDNGDFTHDCGWWVQLRRTAQSLADYLSLCLTSDLPTLDGVKVTADDRYQVADLVNLDLDGTPRKCLIVSITDDITASDGTVQRDQILKLLLLPQEA